MQQLPEFHNSPENFFIIGRNAPQQGQNADESLLSTYRRTGELEVYSELFLRYKPLLTGVAMKYLGDRSHAEDLVMGVFESSRQSALEKDIREFRSWIYVVVKNACLMQLRAEKGIQTEEIDESRVELRFVWHPMEEDLKEQELLKLEDCMKKLSDEQLASIQGFYLRKKSYDELSREMHVSLKQVKSLLQNGRRNLKICMER